MTFLFTRAVLMSVCISLAFSGNAQVAKAPAKSLHEKVYVQAKALADYPTAIQSVHYLLAESGDANSRWNDSLALLYLQSGAYIQAYTLAERMLRQVAPTDLRLEMKGAAARRLNQPLEAISAYSQLFGRTKNAYYGFEQLQLEYGIRRLAEAVLTADNVLKAAGTTDSTQVAVLRRDGKTSQEVGLRAATLFVQAMAYNDLRQEQNAITTLDQVLILAPAYEQAIDLRQKLTNAAAKN